MVSRQIIVSTRVMVSSFVAGSLGASCGYFADFDGPLPTEPAGSNAGAGAGNAARHFGGVAGSVGHLGGFAGRAAGLGGVVGDTWTVTGRAGAAGAEQLGPAHSGGATGAGGVSSTTDSVGGSSGSSSTAGGTAGSTTTRPGVDGAPVTCAEAETRSCSQGGVVGTCGSGIQRCIAGQWSACSIAPATRDTCTPGNDDNCNGKPNDTACSVLQVAAGSAHTCALLSDGMVRCWGANNAGQLGNGTTTLSGTPVLVPDLSGVSSIAAGGDNTCAVLTDGSVRCWGQRADGLLGESQSGVSTLPTALPWSSSLPVSLVTIGGGFACAITKAEATVRCWGRGESGQLGDGIMHLERVPVPVMALGVAGVTSLSAGSSHVCAALSDSTVKCWGTGEHGENGFVEYEARATPIEQSNHGYTVTGIKQVSAGGGYTIAVGILGDVRGWGSNALGQLGVGAGPFGDTGATDTQAPRSINSAVLDAAGGAQSVSTGSSHSCAVLADATVACWGTNGSGRLGIGSTQDAPTPVPIPSLSNIVMVAVGGAHSCAITRDSEVSCWGDNGAGRLGDGTSVNRLSPVSVKKLLP